MALLSPKVVTLLPNPPTPTPPPQEEEDFVIHLWDPTRPLSTQLETVGAMMPVIEGADIMPAGQELDLKP